MREEQRGISQEGARPGVHRFGEQPKRSGQALGAFEDGLGAVGLARFGVGCGELEGGGEEGPFKLAERELAQTRRFQRVKAEDESIHGKGLGDALEGGRFRSGSHRGRE